MKIADGIEMIESSMIVMGREDTVHPTIIFDNEDVILADTGFGGEDGDLKIAKQMEETGLSFASLNKVILTHQDLDHIGGLPRILKNAKQRVEVICHGEEKPYIEGEKKLIKLTGGVMKQLDAMPEEFKKIMISVFENPPKAKVDKIINDGEKLPYCGGIIVIHTPGHTPGHICLYHMPSKTLIAGDALKLEEGKLSGPAKELCDDYKAAVKSLEKLTRYDIKQVICYHGGLLTGDVNERIEELISEIEK